MGPSSELQEGKLAFVYSACVAAVFCSDPTLHMTAEKQQAMAVPWLYAFTETTPQWKRNEVDADGVTAGDRAVDLGKGNEVLVGRAEYEAGQPSREAKRGSLHRTSQAIQLAIVGFLSQTHAVGCLLTASPIDIGTAVDVQGLMVRSTWSRAYRRDRDLVESTSPTAPNPRMLSRKAT